MLQRTITGVISAALLITFMLVRGFALELALTVIAVWGMSEIFDAFTLAGHHPVRWPALLAAALMIPARMLLGEDALLPLMGLVVILTMGNLMFRKEPRWQDCACPFYAAFTVPLPLMMLLQVGDLQPSALGGWMMFSCFFIALVGDMGAMFAGMTLGRHKLNPQLSPNKTWEGAIGGLLSSVFAGCLLWALGNLATPMPPLWHMMLLGLIGGGAAQMGDLSASLIKRYCNIKDFGMVFPGHGGMMDRFDSILFTCFVVYCYCLILY